MRFAEHCLDGSAYDLIDLPGAGLFWIREKRVSLIDLPDSSKKSSDIAFLDDIASYDANVLGLAHGRQASSPLTTAPLSKRTPMRSTMQRTLSLRLILNLLAKISVTSDADWLLR